VVLSPKFIHIIISIITIVVDMGLIQSIKQYWEYNEDPTHILTNFETKDLHVSKCLIRRGFHLHQATRAAHLSFLAYYSAEEIAEYMNKYVDHHQRYHVQSTFHDPETDADGFIMMDNQEHSLYIVFRGTCNRRDMLTDLEFIPITYENMEGVKVHSGIYTSLLSVREYLLNYVKGWQEKYAKERGGGVGQNGELLSSSVHEPKVYIVGHSLGGCLASLLAPILYRECGVYAHVYSMGGCPVGNEPFMRLFKDCTASHWNVVNHLDIVPILTRPIKLGYSQFPQIAYYDGRGDLVYLSGRKFNDQMAYRLLQRILGWKKTDQILNHLQYFGLTTRTARETPLDQYEYCAAAQDTWLDDDNDPTDDSTNASFSSSSCSDDDVSCSGGVCVVVRRPPSTSEASSVTSTNDTGFNHGDNNMMLASAGQLKPTNETLSVSVVTKICDPTVDIPIVHVRSTCQKP